MATIQIRLGGPNDFDEICRLLDADHMNDGVHTLRLVHSTSAPIFVVATDESGEIVGVHAKQKLRLPEGDVVFGLFKDVRPDYRRQRVSHRLADRFRQYPDIGNMTTDALRKTPNLRKFGSKVHVFAGRPTIEQLDNDHTIDCAVEAIDYEIDIDRVIDYDRTVFDYDRGRFTREWCRPSGDQESYARTVVAKKGEEVVGFGTLRLLGESYSVQPLYANDETCALGILKELTRLYASECDKKPVEIMFFATNRTMFRFVRQAKFQHYYCTVRVYIDGDAASSRVAEAVEKYIRKERVYCMQYYWPV